MDVATARTEHYERPAALPVVEHASIQRDLHRRDFTINAMAVDVSAEGFGRLVDPFGGAEDLAAGRLRVLHNLSFIEDPTRIFRACGTRTATASRWSPRRASWPGRASRWGWSARSRAPACATSWSRSCPRTGSAAPSAGCASSGWTPRCIPRWTAGEAVAGLIGRIDAVRARLAPDALVWQSRMGAISRRIPGDELVELLERLRIRRRDARVVCEVAVVAPRLAAPLAAAADRARVGELLDAHPVEVAVSRCRFETTSARRRPRSSTSSSCERCASIWTATRCATSWGCEESPLVGEILAELLRRRRNGGVESREAQLAAARELAAEAVS